VATDLLVATTIFRTVNNKVGGKMKFKLSILIGLLALTAGISLSAYSPAIQPQQSTERGYQNGRSGRDDDDRDEQHGQNNQYGQYGRGNNLAAQMGSQDGVNDGRTDRRTGHSNRPTKGDNYKSASRGYSSMLGNKDRYKATYRQAYLPAYQEGYSGPSNGRR
jgi:hypothetical protein